MTDYYRQARDDEALYVTFDKEYDPEGAKERVLERLQEDHPSFDLDATLDVDSRFLDRLVDEQLIIDAEDHYYWLLDAINYSKPKSMDKAERRWVGRDESVLYQNSMFEIRLYERDCDFVIIFALRSDYEGYYSDEVRLRNLAVGKLRSHAKAFFNRMHENYGFDLPGNIYSFIYREGKSQAEQEKEQKKHNEVKNMAQVNDHLVTLFG